MRERHRAKFLRLVSIVGLLLLALLCVTMIACGYSPRQVRRAETELEPGWPKSNNRFRPVSLAPIYAELPVIEGAEFVNDDELCMTCHNVYVETFPQNVHHGIHQERQSCEACHGPASRHLQTRGQERGLLWNFKELKPAQASEVCLKCHEQNACTPGAQWRMSKHAHAGMACTACHTSHYNVPPGTPATTLPSVGASNEQRQPLSLASFQEELDPVARRQMSNHLNAVAPNVCFRCHGDMQNLAAIAGPHQIGGPNGFNCTSCHDPHGNIFEYSRRDLCLECHQQGSPTMAWHSSTHHTAGVACTDCHNPHPHGAVQQSPDATSVDLLYTHVSRPKRRPMSVQEPETCYKCHPQIFGLTHLPSHHPIREGKVVCSDCHDPHGQLDGSLKAENKNQLCWKCHADKQGPFAYEHPPVTEDCGICHEPHGTVTNNLLKQPPTFLCLRCHVGHRDGDHGSGARVNIDTIPEIRQALYTDCTQCHSQIHGSDLPTPHFPAMFR